MDKIIATRFHCLLPVIFALLISCQSLPQPTVTPPVSALLPIAVASHEFIVDSVRDDVIGAIQIVTANQEDTLSDIARRFNLGYEEIVNANPGIDPWLPKAGAEIVIPTQFVLPDAPRQGIVINLAAMRLFYYPRAKAGEPQRVITHPVGIGRVEWKTPEGVTRVVAKKANPSWIPTASIRKEHAKNGNPLPAIVPPGPDNPMGTHVLKLDWPSYAIHGTDKPPSIGLRGSHGCLRMYPEDIIGIYNGVPVGTPVRIVNQPRLFGWRGGDLYIQTYPVLEDDKRNHGKLMIQSLTTARASAKAKHGTRPRVEIQQAIIGEAIRTPSTIAIPVTQPGMTLRYYLERAKRVQNALPFNATWGGDMSRQMTASEVLKITSREAD